MRQGIAALQQIWLRFGIWYASMSRISQDFPVARSQSMSVQILYGGRQGPSLTVRLRSWICSMLLAVAHISAKNQEVEPFGL
jgi:hypothetical protein